MAPVLSLMRATHSAGNRFLTTRGRFNIWAREPANSQSPAAAQYSVSSVGCLFHFIVVACTDTSKKGDCALIRRASDFLL
jgi:hypothetical protein